MVNASSLFLPCLVPLLSLASLAQGDVDPVRGYKSVDGVRMYYEMSGSGSPLVLLHTFFGTVHQWTRYTEELSKHFTVIVVDLPGHGKSDPMDTTDVYSNKRAANYVHGLLSQLQVDSAYVWGASSGGTIALQMAIHHPGTISKLAVLGSQLYYSRQTRHFLEERGEQAPDDESIANHGKDKAQLLEKQFYRYRTLYDELNITADQLSTIRAKTLIISGDNDVPAPLTTNAIQMFQSIPGAQLWVVPDGGHLPHLDEDHHEEFLKRIVFFFKNENG